MASSKPDLPQLSSFRSRSSISGIPMSELDPSPVDEEQPTLPTNPSDLDAKTDPFLPANATSSTNFLGLTPARTLHLLSALQKYSTIGPAIYLAMHYSNTALIPLATRSLKTSDNMLLLTRPYYQSFPIEQLLIMVPVLTHVVSGITLRIYRRRQSAKRHGAETHADRSRIPWPKLSLTSALGYTFVPLYMGHVLVNRMTPLKVEGGSSGVGLRYFAHGIAKHPLVTNVGYAGMLCVASWHIVGGAAKFLKLSSDYVTEGGDDGRWKRRTRGWVVNGISAAVAVVWIAGGLGVIGRGGKGEGWEASNWDKIYREVPVIGRWM